MTSTYAYPADIPSEWQTLGTGMPDATHYTLDQHATALDSLSMDQPHPVHIPLIEGTPWSHPFMTPMYTPHLELDLDSDPYSFVTSNEEYLNLLNRDQFLPVTLYYKHFIDGDGLGLEDLSTPPVITRQDLRGEACDMQGISWDSLSTTREIVRKKRTGYQESHLSPALKRTRKVCKSLDEILTSLC
jgi:hypothetical protein